MWYTVWKKISDDTYKFYMAAEHSTHAVQAAPVDAIITKSDFILDGKYRTREELARYDKLDWAPAPGER